MGNWQDIHGREGDIQVDKDSAKAQANDKDQAQDPSLNFIYAFEHEA